MAHTAHSLSVPGRATRGTFLVHVKRYLNANPSTIRISPEFIEGLILTNQFKVIETGLLLSNLVSKLEARFRSS